MYSNRNEAAMNPQSAFRDPQWARMPRFTVHIVTENGSQVARAVRRGGRVLGRRSCWRHCSSRSSSARSSRPLVAWQASFAAGVQGGSLVFVDLSCAGVEVIALSVAAILAYPLPVETPAGRTARG